MTIMLKIFEINQMNLSRLLGTKYQMFLQKAMKTDESYLRVDSRISDLFRRSLASWLSLSMQRNERIGIFPLCIAVI